MTAVEKAVTKYDNIRKLKFYPTLPNELFQDQLSLYCSLFLFGEKRKLSIRAGSMRNKCWICACLIIIFTFTGNINNSIADDLNKNISNSNNNLLKSSENMTEKYVPGEMLVKFKEKINREGVEAINKGFNTTIIKKVKTQNLYLIKIPEGKSIENMIKKYNQLPEVEYSEPNYIYQIDEGGRKHDE